MRVFDRRCLTRSLQWHDAGRLFNKKNTFEDVLSCSQYLVDNKIAAKGKVIVHGGSNGGLMVGAVLNAAEERHGIGAGIAEVGVREYSYFSFVFCISSGFGWERTWSEHVEGVSWALRSHHLPIPNLISRNTGN